MESPSYYAIIPANVRYSKIPPNSKLLYGEITALASKTGRCFASDGYFAGLYDVSKTSIQSRLKQLDDNGFIRREVEYKEGSKEILHRYINILVYPTQDNLCTPTQDNLGDSITSISNTINNTNNNKKQKEILFDLFWSAYPNKQGKDVAYKKYPIDQHDVIMAGLENQKKIFEAKDKLGERHANWKYGSTWINTKTWLDYQDTGSIQEMEFEAIYQEYVADYPNYFAQNRKKKYGTDDLFHKIKARYKSEFIL